MLCLPYAGFLHMTTNWTKVHDGYMRILDFHMSLASFPCQEHITIYSGQGHQPGGYQNILWARQSCSCPACQVAAWPLCWRTAMSPISAVQVRVQVVVLLVVLVILILPTTAITITTTIGNKSPTTIIRPPTPPPSSQPN